MNDRQRRTLVAIIDRLTPQDDFPSASAAGVDRYIVRQLEGDLRERSAMILDGLDRLGRAGFDQLSAAEQDAMIQQLETGDDRDRLFIQMLIQLAHEGYYADPGNGGNVDMIAWKMIGYPAVDQVERR